MTGPRVSPELGQDVEQLLAELGPDTEPLDDLDLNDCLDWLYEPSPNGTETT